MIAAQNRAIGQLTADVHYLKRVGPTVDHIAETEKDVLIRGRDARECATERSHVAVNVGNHIGCHVPLLSLPYRTRAISPATALGVRR